MSPGEWEETVQKIVDESNLEQKEPGKHKILTQWRAKLGHEPTLLPPYKIDLIVREVRRRLESQRR